MTAAPERIWLQWEGHAGDTTWCDEEISDTDIAYVRADKLAEAENILRKWVEMTERHMKENFLAFEANHQVDVTQALRETRAFLEGQSE